MTTYLFWKQKQKCYYHLKFTYQNRDKMLNNLWPLQHGFIVIIKKVHSKLHQPTNTPAGERDKVF